MINQDSLWEQRPSLLVTVTASNRQAIARRTEHDTSKIYPVAEAFRTNCLLRDLSLLFEGSSVWRSEVLDQIHTAFVVIPDEGDRSFIVKFKDQGGKAGPEEVRLASEIF